jgi:hypothetical protein
MLFRSLLAIASIAMLGPCGKDESKTAPSASASATVAAPATTTAPPAASSAGPAASSAVAVPPGAPPPDGTYENVKVDGVTVPVIKVMEKGAIVLIDTDGKKPRTWEEEYKRKRADLPNGAYDLHKTDVKKDGDFKNDEVDKMGLWVIDAKGNITKQ